MPVRRSTRFEYDNGTTTGSLTLTSSEQPQDKETFCLSHYGLPEPNLQKSFWQLPTFWIVIAVAAAIVVWRVKRFREQRA